MTEEKLLELINKDINMLPLHLRRRIIDIHHKGGVDNISKYVLEEYDLVQDKKSYLTKSQRDQVVGFVGLCMIKMTKDDGTTGQ